jgi:hypothetical protein
MNFQHLRHLILVTCKTTGIQSPCYSHSISILLAYIASGIFPLKNLEYRSWVALYLLNCPGQCFFILSINSYITESSKMTWPTVDLVKSSWYWSTQDFDVLTTWTNKEPNFVTFDLLNTVNLLSESLSFIWFIYISQPNVLVSNLIYLHIIKLK